LFVRTKRATELTAAGRQLLDDARPLLAAADATRRRVALAARGSKTFTIGFMPGLTVTEAVRAFGMTHPDLEIELIRTTWDDQVDVLHDGRVDVSVVRLPIDQVRGATGRHAAGRSSPGRQARHRHHRPRRRAPAAGPRRRTGMA
jgi:DNA-binding transcriptional LysR family regulator